MKTGKRILFVIAAAVFLAGCATQAQRQSDVISTSVRTANQNVQACVTANYNNPQFALLRNHFSNDPRDTSLAQLSDDHFATEQEIVLLFAYDAGAQGCRKAYLDQLQTVVPTVAGIVAEYYTKVQDNLLDLIKRKQTWGGYVKSRSDMSQEVFSRQNAEYQRIAAGLNQENNAELARRQAAAAAYLQYEQTQQIINNMNRPVVTPTIYTNCNQYGNTVNCTTH